LNTGCKDTSMPFGRIKETLKDTNMPFGRIKETLKDTSMPFGRIKETLINYFLDLYCFYWGSVLHLLYQMY